jgi:hypothetical protein
VKWGRWILCFIAAFFLLLKEFLGRVSSIGVPLITDLDFANTISGLRVYH